MKTLEKRQLQETLESIDESIKLGVSSAAGNYIIAADAVPELEVVVVLFADKTAVVKDFDWFEPNPKYSPNFNIVTILDHGQTLQLGTYEVGADSLRE